MDTNAVRKLGPLLLVIVPADLTDSDITELRREAVKAARKHASKWVLLDFSQVEICDSYFGRFIHTMSQMAQLVGAKAIVCGLSDAVIETLVDMGLWLEGVEVTLDVDTAVARLEAGRT
jgi:anti-anti-sigma regulatory factor